MLAISASSLDSGWLLGLLAGSPWFFEAWGSLLVAGPAEVFLGVVLGLVVKKLEQNNRAIVAAVPANIATINFCRLCFFFFVGFGCCCRIGSFWA